MCGNALLGFNNIYSRKTAAISVAVILSSESVYNQLINHFTEANPQIQERYYNLNVLQLIWSITLGCKSEYAWKLLAYIIIILLTSSDGWVDS